MNLAFSIELAAKSFIDENRRPRGKEGHNLMKVYRPGASIGDGRTADVLIYEFYEGNSKHLLKAKERLKSINKIINSGNLGLNDLDIAEAIRDDLEYAIGLFL